MAEAPFDALLTLASAGDFVYFDPSYAPLSATSAFRSYTAGGFGDGDHELLHRFGSGARVTGRARALSNSVAPGVVDVYDNQPARRAGPRAWRVPARRAINSRATSRGPVEELLVSTADESI